MGRHSVTRKFLSAFAASAVVAAIPGVAGADEITAAYGQWEMTDSSAGRVVVPNSTFPTGAVTSDSSRTSAPSGKSTFLNENTPVGQEFGSSRGQQYLLFRTASGRQPSTTTINFDAVTPPDGWAFALGDIDADEVTISASGEDGQSLTAEQLGWQSAFNYCATSPKPSSCRREPFTDMPSWDAERSALIGTGGDTDGATGWFRPSVPVKSLSILFKVQSGIPSGQLWIAAPTEPQDPQVPEEEVPGEPQDPEVPQEPEVPDEGTPGESQDPDDPQEPQVPDEEGPGEPQDPVDVPEEPETPTPGPGPYMSCDECTKQAIKEYFKEQADAYKGLVGPAAPALPFHPSGMIIF